MTMILVSGFFTLYNVNCNLAFSWVVVGALITRGGSSVMTHCASAYHRGRCDLNIVHFKDLDQ